MRSLRDRAVVFGQAGRSTARLGWGLVAVAGGAIVLGLAVGQAWVVLLPVSLALVLSTLLQPATAWMRRRGVPAALAALLVVAGSVAALAGLATVITVQVVDQLDGVVDEATAGLEQVQTWVTDGPLHASDSQVDAAIDAVQSRLQDSADAIASGALSTVGAVSNAVVNTVVVVVLCFFFAKDGHRFLPWVRRLTGRRAGDHAGEVLGRSWDTLGGFVRAQSVISLFDAVLIGAGLLVLDVPLAVPLAVITFIGAFVPIAGTLVSGGLTVLVALVTDDLRTALLVLALVVVVQQLESNVLSPVLQGKAMRLHAGVILLSVTAGSSLFGVSGAFLAVPAVAVAATVARYGLEQVDRAAVDEPKEHERDQEAEAAPASA
ncbi:AI-2E family transporter [Solicola sp. PLA-1-18]|uniref:AI-2E family transporter n=1 Tax=Solicola sp. PLA-1-18 TaxID=3380532 RepID=UPI003B7B03DD